MEIRPRVFCVAKSTRESVAFHNPTFLASLEERYQGASSWRYDYHIRETMYDRYIPQELVEETLRSCSLLDIQLMSSSEVRLLIRNPTTGLCVVVNPYSFRAVTAYRNNPNDHHGTMKDSEKRLYMTFQEFSKKYTYMVKEMRSEVS